ncbi:DUF4012 domain-containing protein [Collinsella aerofaciens]|uniref:DUF4012 domain-containing protein n=1 Tax=Collinsella aerofaciens TaxID=74426 RepID=UPI001D0236C1|nr:DUF4012 domain-containing protein [Collinsella aerofaciens]MCB5365818.1 DUF4012 domain-containing protein [Collinsella aerofaciens]MCB5367389.1 DUF4012 domain-containing protein [Collinsella aerofaciens]
MAGNHFKNGDGERSAVPPRSNGAGNAGVPSGSSQNGAGNRTSPGETAMFAALYEQSQKAKQAGRVGRQAFPGGAGSAASSAGVHPVPTGGANAAGPTGPANNAHRAHNAGPINSANPANSASSAGDAGLTGNLGTIYTGASETGTFARLNDDGAEFKGSGSKEDYYDFGLNYGGDSSTSSTSDGLVRHRHRKGERKKRRVTAVVAAIVVVVLVAFGVSGFMLLNSAKTVKSQAKETVEIVGGLKDKVTSGDFSTLPDDAKKIDELCSSMKKETSSPVWTMASFIPVYGSDINAARTMVDALSDVSSGALVPMADNLAQATPGKLFQDGTINVSALQAVADSLSSSSKVFKSANKKVQSIGDTHIAQVTELVDKAKDGFATLDGAVDAAEKVAPVLPQMLGANGQTRNYLVYAMNNVEIRACGGFGGSQGLISVTDGQMSIGDFVPCIARSKDEAVESVDEEDETLFGDHSNLYISGNTYSPDWPRNSQRVAALWKSEYGQDVDGVIGIDPVFLQYLLGLVGNVSLPDGTVVDGTNAAKVLMHDVYWNYPVEESDGIFAAVASAAFDKILGGIGDVDVAKLVDAVERGADEGRLIAWMKNDDEQNAIKEMGIDASLPDPDDPSADPVAGVYFNNLSFSKLDWYLNADTQIGQGVKNGDGTCSYRITVTLTNVMTQEEAGKLPDYVAASAPGTARDDERLYVSLFAPTGGGITDLAVEGTQFGLFAATWHGVPCYSGTVDLHAGETTTITYTLTTSAEAGDKPLALRQTPTCQAARDSASA